MGDAQTHYLWRAVDHKGEVLESYVTKTRDRAAASKFIKKAMKRHPSPEVIVTDKLRSYAAALREIGAADLQEAGRHLNNRAENSHLPFRRRERAMQRFRRMETPQKFASVHASIHNPFDQGRDLNKRQKSIQQTPIAGVAKFSNHRHQVFLDTSDLKPQTVSKVLTPNTSDVRAANRLKYVNGRSFSKIEDLQSYLASLEDGAEIEAIFWQPPEYKEFSGGHIVAKMHKSKLEWVAPGE